LSRGSSREAERPWKCLRDAAVVGVEVEDEITKAVEDEDPVETGLKVGAPIEGREIDAEEPILSAIQRS